jgi:phosphatidylglycerol:prolipoprotein diacylglycerol transferase
MIAYPHIDPIIFTLGPVAVHWYGLMYVVGFVVAWLLARRRAAQSGSTWTPVDVDDLIFFAALGVIAGGRIGWILFYGLEDILVTPMRALRIWEGGMSFHGGLIGVVLMVTWFAKRRKRAVGDVWDFTAPLPAIGLFTGRIGNFINGELWGKPTDMPWGFVVDGVARHPSQLYEALLEGIVTFIIVWVYSSKPRPRWSVAGLFLVCYGVFRSLVELVRIPDENRGYLLLGWVTEGQLLSVPMIMVGVGLMVWAYRKGVPTGNVTPKNVVGNVK